MRKLFFIFTLLLLMLITFLPKAFADEVYKFTAANFDTSNSMVVLSAQDNDLDIIKNIKLVKMENPKRVYFDLNSSIITFPKQDWIFKSGGINEIKISQFSNDPCVVRVVIYYNEDFNPGNIQFQKINNNIILKFKSADICDNEYFQNIYRDEHSSSSDFYEYMTVTTPVTTPSDDNVVGQIQEAFNTPVEPTFEKKELKLNTKYYLNNITIRDNGVLLNGFGAATLEKPMILQNPSRIVYDLPNTLVNTELRNKEFKISETQSVKIGQFSVNKARIVITTDDVNSFIPIYSSDNQSLLIVNHNKLNRLSLFNNSSNVISYRKEKIDALTESMVLDFDAPIVHGIDRHNDKVILYLYNVLKYNETLFQTTYEKTLFENAKIELMPQVGLKLTIPIQQDSIISTYLGSDGKSLKIRIKEAKKRTFISKQPTIVDPNMKIKVLLDAGHGGTDTGAIGGDINEKDITLEVAKRVEKLLKQRGYDVHMTRSGDVYVSLQDRVAISEEYCPDIFVSIHVNSSVKPEITGVETHYYHQESMGLAQTIHEYMASAIDTVNRGLFKSKFYVINHTTMPAILLEIGFISNEEERAQLIKNSRKQLTAKAIADGIDEYFGRNKK